MQPRIGIDSYSYHRLLGELRPGERPRDEVWSVVEVVEHARALAVDGISLETCFLEPPAALDVEAFRDLTGGMELVFAWGHPHGFAFGANREALSATSATGSSLPPSSTASSSAASSRARDSAGRGRSASSSGPRSHRSPLPPSRARAVGLELALENHGDLRAAELLELVERVDDSALVICFDTANALRVGDDPVEAARRLAPLTRMVHLKDVEPLDRVVDPVAGPCSVPYGEGVVAVSEILAALRAAEFGGLVCVEIGQVVPGSDELALVESCVDWLRTYASSNG